MGMGWEGHGGSFNCKVRVRVVGIIPCKKRLCNARQRADLKDHLAKDFLQSSCSAVPLVLATTTFALASTNRAGMP